MGRCPNGSGLCFCTGACRDDNTWVPDPPSDPYTPYVPPGDDDSWDGWTDTFTLTNPTYFWAFPQEEIDASEALRFVSLEKGAQLDQFYEGYAIIRGDFIPNLIDWGEAGFTIVAVDDSRNGIQQQIRDLS